MWRAFRAFAWLRWRLLRNQLRGGRRRDTFEQISRALALVVPAMLVTLALGSIVGIGGIGLFAGRAVARGTVEPALVTFVTRALLVLAFILVVGLAVAAPNQSALTRYTRLLLLPIRRQSLHLVEVASTLADPWLAAFAFGLVMLPLGLLIGGAPAAAFVAFVAALPLMALLALAGALATFLCSWLLRSRRRGEMFTLVFVLGLALLSLLPMLLVTRPGESQADRRVRAGHPFSIAAFDRGLPRWSVAVPSELYARALGAGIAGEQRTAWLATLALVVEVCLLGWCSSVAHGKLLDSVESTRSTFSRRGRGRTGRWTLPAISPIVSAVAFAQARTALRSVRGRLTVLLPGPMTAILPVMLAQTSTRSARESWLIEVGTHGHWVLGVSLLFALYSMQAFTMNLFGTDRGGLTLTFLSPIKDAELARGKFVGCVLMFSVAVVFCLMGAALATRDVRFALWLAATAGSYAALAVMFPACVWLSALFPVAADLSKTGSGGNPHALPMLIGTVAVVVAALPVAIPMLLVRLWPWADWLIALAMLVWLTVAIPLSWFLIGLVSPAIAARRENLALVAQGR